MLINYKAVIPLVESASLTDTTLLVTFRCPVNGKDIRSSASVGDEAASILRSGVAGAVRRACGLTEQEAGSKISGDALKQMSAAVLDAFTSVQNQFVWDTTGSRFISAEAAGQVLTPFNQQLATARVAKSHDQDVLARILVEVACADGDLGDEERAFLSSFLPRSVNNPRNLVAQAQMTPLTVEDLHQCSSGPIRDTMLMLGYALAFTDEQLAPEEAAQLEKLAAGLEISEPRAQQLKMYAQVYLVDNALGRAYAGGERDNKQFAWVMELAKRIGLAAVEAEGADIRFRRRYGLA